MIVSKSCAVEHNLPYQEDQILVLNNSLVALFFFRHNKYILYDYLRGEAMGELPLPEDTFSAALLESEEYIITSQPLHTKVTIIHPQTGERFREIEYKIHYPNVIPSMKLFSNNDFGLFMDVGKEKKLFYPYADFKQTQTMFCNDIVQQFSPNSLVTYNQIQLDNLVFKVFTPLSQKQYVVSMSMREKLVMKIVEYKEEEVMVVYLHMSHTYFIALSLTSLQSTQLLELKDELLLDFVTQRGDRELYVCSMWRDWNEGKDKELGNIVIIKRNGEEMDVVQRLDLGQGRIGNSIRRGGMARSVYSKSQGSARGTSEFEVLALSSLRNRIIDMLVKAGAVRDYGESIVKKVLSLRDY